MKNRIFLFLIVVMISCESDSVSPTGVYTVQGYVYYLGDLANSVTVSIDGQYNWSSTTSNDGYFSISGVSEGNHELRYKKENVLDQSASDSLGFTEKTISISVYDDVVLDHLRLPKVIYLYPAEDIGVTGARVLWSPTDDESFREYKLFRHITSGLDETTGTLVHVSTSLTDTTFYDEDLEPYQQYFYRIYVMNDFGKLGGSNLISFYTSNIQLLNNGGFENNSATNPIGWDMVPNTGNSIEIDSLFSYEGSNSLKFSHNSPSGCWEMWIYQYIDGSLLTEGSAYDISMRYTANFDENTFFNLIISNSSMNEWITIPLEFNDSQQWSELDFTFELPNEVGTGQTKIDLHFCVEGVRTWWLDDIEIVKVTP